MILRLVKDFESSDEVHAWGKTEYSTKYALCGDWCMEYEFLGSSSDVNCEECLKILRSMILSDKPVPPPEPVDEEDDSAKRFAQIELD